MTETHDLVTRLLAAIEAAEKLALAASPGPWTTTAEHDEVLAVDGIPVADGFALSGRQLRATVDHIIGQDPLAVLRRCAADRKILAIHHPERAGGYVDCAVCREPFTPEAESEAWPCGTILALAEGYGLAEQQGDQP